MSRSYLAHRPGIYGDTYFVSFSWLPFMICQAGTVRSTAQQTLHIWRASLACLAILSLLPLAGCQSWSAGLAPLAPQPRGLGSSGAQNRHFWRLFLCFLGSIASSLPGRRRLLRSSANLVHLARTPGHRVICFSGFLSWFAGPTRLAPQLSSLGISGAPAFRFWRKFLCFLWLAACSGLPGRRRLFQSSADLAYSARRPGLLGGAFSVSFIWLPVVVCRPGAACCTVQQRWHISNQPGISGDSSVPLFPLVCCLQWIAWPAPFSPQFRGLGVSIALAQLSWRRFLCFL